MYLAIIVLPLLGSIVSGFFGRKVGVSGAQFLSSIAVVTTAILALVLFIEVCFNSVSVSVFLFRWLDLESMNVLWGFNFDFLTVSMLIPVLVISCLVHIYSVGYMSSDPHNQRFFSYLSLFTFMMIILVTSNSFLLMFVGWEGVGVCSYLLVNFWYTRIAANQSSISAFLTNRVGDCFLTIGMIIILLTFGNLDYTTVFSIAPFVSEDSISLIGICLLIGAMAKSSQLGLHVWLPLAMEGPTPVSALIHAATMVTAGVYLLMRTSPLIEYSSTVLLTTLWIGSITTVFSSIVGLFQQDIKKVIAYSTMSQLGMMVIAIGLSSYNIALFHLVNHAFYKGLLFLGAGAVIHAVADNQDFRRYGGLILFLPLTYTVMLIASLSLVAFPFMTGFYSKDFILEASFAQFNYSGIAVYFTAVLGAIFTTLYSVKVLYLTFINTANGPIINYNKAHEGDIFMSLPLVLLALFSTFFGFLGKDIFIGLASHASNDNSLFIHPLHETTISSEFAVSHLFKLLPFFLTLIITVLCVIVLEYLPLIPIYTKLMRLGYSLFSFFNLKFLVESLYNRHITYLILNIGGQTTKVLDKGSIEKIGPYGLEKSLTKLSNNLNSLNTGVVTTYALYILIGFMTYISLPLLMSKYLKVLFVIFYCLLFYVLKINNNVIKNNRSKYHKQTKQENDDFYKNLTIVKSANTSLIIVTYMLAACLALYNHSKSPSVATENISDKIMPNNKPVSEKYNNGLGDLVSKCDISRIEKAESGNIKFKGDSLCLKSKEHSFNSLRETLYSNSDALLKNIKYGMEKAGEGMRLAYDNSVDFIQAHPYAAVACGVVTAVGVGLYWYNKTTVSQQTDQASDQASDQGSDQSPDEPYDEFISIPLDQNLVQVPVTPTRPANVYNHARDILDTYGMLPLPNTLTMYRINSSDIAEYLRVWVQLRYHLTLPRHDLQTDFVRETIVLNDGQRFSSDAVAHWPLQVDGIRCFIRESTQLGGPRLPSVVDPAVQNPDMVFDRTHMMITYFYDTHFTWIEHNVYRYNLSNDIIEHFLTTDVERNFGPMYDGAFALQGQYQEYISGTLLAFLL